MQDFVYHRYPPSERFEQRFFIHLFSREFFIANVRQNHFLKGILTEGIELHNAGILPLENINLRKSVKSKYRQWVASQAERCLNHVDLLLEDADNKTITMDTRLSGFYLYFALEQIFIALEYKQYGFVREFDHISRRFMVAVHGSAELNKFFESRCNEILKMFKVLKKLRDDSLYCETDGTPDETIYRYMDLIKKIKKLVEGN